MATGLLDAEDAKDRLTSLLVTDFCPWANRYVYWLKEPIGWFAIALAISVLVGLHVSSVGWVLATVLGGLIAVGMIWPWVVVRAARCELRPAVAEIHEGESCDLVLAVRNRLPLPLWGLAVEGYLDRRGDDTSPTIALACVPMASDAEYRLRVAPSLRGCYPVVPPKITCSMPFGLWTATRELAALAPLTVFPRISQVQDDPELVGGRLSETGDGTRVGQSGEPQGVREFRSGDRLRNVHWVHTARTGTLTVCERGGPQQQQVDVVLDIAGKATFDAAERSFLRESMARRVRVAASLAIALHGRHVPVRLVIGDAVTPLASGAAGRRRLLTTFAEVPVDGVWAGDGSAEETRAGFRPQRDRLTLVVRGDVSGNVLVEVDRFTNRTTMAAAERMLAGAVEIGPDVLLDVPLSRFWRDVRHATRTA